MQLESSDVLYLKLEYLSRITSKIHWRSCYLAAMHEVQIQSGVFVHTYIHVYIYIYVHTRIHMYIYSIVLSKVSNQKCLLICSNKIQNLNGNITVVLTST